ncbi:calponin homology domain-containing protein [Jimgerdemannia flammicorona]|uniref:Calponin homology domain-containing protein n=2 Tax=Jimgerdemannia flammicorona TaxID=994334 RepID=A0A433A0B4_9FUNG|nr:calponin homology domain-containing protein [Jimgerdemannia flammicorona]
MSLGESRSELLSWLNELLQINYTKIELVGTGDLSMNKVKFDTKHDYEYVTNYKILQSAFDKHKIDKIIPVERLMKCKFQDNLEFLQWLKKYWDQYYPGGAYDAGSRRKGGHGASSSTGPARASGGTRTMASKKPAAGGTGVRSAASRNTAGASGRLSSSSGNSAVLDQNSAAVIIDLNKQLGELKATVDGLEKERDFYFGKLRDIEILVQQQQEADASANVEESPVLKEIQNILYSTEEGFEVPPEGEVEGEGDIEDETF